MKRRIPYTRNIGYVRRWSWKPNNVDEQIEILRRHDCHEDNIWIETAGYPKYPELAKALMDARTGDVFTVATFEPIASRKITRFVFGSLEGRGIPFRVLDIGLDTRDPGVEELLAMTIEALDTRWADDHEILMRGIAKARAEGRVGGRRVVLPEDKRAEALQLISMGIYSMEQIAERLGVSRRSLYNAGLVASRKKKAATRAA